jgi:PAS domain S-box-containing protein
MSAYVDSRLLTVIRLERFALFARYVAFFVLVSLYLLRPGAASIRDLIIVTSLVALHNAMVHVVLWTKRYHLFLTPLNFLIHLSATTFIVMFTGAEESQLYVLYFFLLIGYTAYSRRYIMIIIVSLIFCLSYSMMIGVEWSLRGLVAEREEIVLRILSIPLCGWLVATISELVREAEDVALAQAQALASSEATLRTILDNTVDPIIVHDEKELISEANRKVLEILGLPHDQVIGRPFRQFLFDDGTLPQLISDIHKNGVYHGEQLFIDADGQDHAVELHVASFTRAGHKFFVVVAHDIAEQKELQEAAHLANRNLNRLNRQLQQVNDLKTGLLRSTSLRIRSPLTAVLGYFDMLLQDEFGLLAPEQRKALQSCRRSILRVFDLLEEAHDLHFQDRAEPPHRDAGEV